MSSLSLFLLLLRKSYQSVSCSISTHVKIITRPSLNCALPVYLPVVSFSGFWCRAFSRIQRSPLSNESLYRRKKRKSGWKRMKGKRDGPRASFAVSIPRKLKVDCTSGPAGSHEKALVKISLSPLSSTPSLLVPVRGLRLPSSLSLPLPAFRTFGINNNRFYCAGRKMHCQEIVSSGITMDSLFIIMNNANHFSFSRSYTPNTITIYFWKRVVPFLFSKLYYCILWSFRALECVGNSHVNNFLYISRKKSVKRSSNWSFYSYYDRSVGKLHDKFSLCGNTLWFRWHSLRINLLVEYRTRIFTSLAVRGFIFPPPPPPSPTRQAVRWNKGNISGE